jgi:hypothetical protein
MTDQTMAALMDAPQERQIGFSRYQSLLIALLAFTQFTIILDFIIMSPLDRRPVDRGDHRHRVRDAAGQRAFATEAGWESVPAFDRDRRAAALHTGLRGDDAAGDRRLRADAIQQRLYRAQSCIDIAHLPTIYLVSGLFTIVMGPLVGRASDTFGKYPTFVLAAWCP